MSNFDLHRKWVQRYAERINQPPQNPPNTLPPAPIGTSDPGQQLPITLPSPSGTYSFLQGNFGKQFLKEYNKKVKKDYADAQTLKVLTWNDTEKVVVGSNPFAVVLINEMLASQGIHTATQADLEHIVRGNLLPLKGHYEESSLVWRSNADPNEYLATKIYNQLKSTGKMLKTNHSYVFPLHTLSLEKDTNAPQSLAFKARGNSTFFPNVYFEAPILMSTSGKYISDADFDFTQGLPTKVFDSTQSILIPNRQLYTLVGGLSRFYLGSYLYVSADDDNLAGSDDGGRVVLVSGAATTQKNPGATP